MFLNLVDGNFCQGLPWLWFTDSFVCFISVAIGMLVLILAVVIIVVIIRYVRKNRNVSASYKRTFAKAGSKDELREDAMIVISDDDF